MKQPKKKICEFSEGIVQIRLKGKNTFFMDIARMNTSLNTKSDLISAFFLEKNFA